MKKILIKGHLSIIANIILIVKDKNDDIVWESNIKNHEYFHNCHKDT